MIVDAHVHLLPRKVQQDRTPFCHSDLAFGSIYSSGKAKVVSEADIIRYLDDSDIDLAIVFGFPWEQHDLVRQNNDEIWEFHHRYPHRIIPFAILSPMGGEGAHLEAERALDGGFAGIGELAMYHGGWSRADFEALSPSLELARKARVPVMIHVNEPVGHPYPGKIPVDFRGLLHIIEANPDVDFILSHFGGGVFVYGLMPEIAGILSRTYLDTAASPFLYDHRIFEVACRIMGPEKIVFGSDYPLIPLARYLKELDKAEVDGALRERILGGNIRRLLERNGRLGAQDRSVK
ncbi:MAG: amidohydrolase family protein [Desulfomonilaceae bacterium]